MCPLPLHTGSVTLRFVIYTDGAARGNPGPAAIGAVLYADSGGELKPAATISEAIGDTTNNVAEYRAVVAALHAARDAGALDVELRSDSQLLVRQLTGAYRVKATHLQPLHAEALAVAAHFDRFTVRHVFREENSEADALANAALDR